MGPSTVGETVRGWLEYFSNDAPIGHALQAYGEWAEAEVSFLMSLLDAGATVVDVGAHVGSHSLAFARRVGSTGSVLAFEPQAAVCELLKRNMALNGCTHVRTFQRGVGARQSQMWAPAVDYDTPTNIGGIALQPENAGEGEPVLVVTLDSLKLTSCDLIKVDAEGMGAEVVEGASDVIRDLRPILAVECNSVAEALDAYRAQAWGGYRIALLRSPAFNPNNFKRNDNNFFGPARETTLLFLPEERAAGLSIGTLSGEVIPIADLDGLATHLLATPRYGDATPFDRDPEQLRGRLASMEAELRARAAELEKERNREAQLRDELSALRVRAQRERERLEFRAATLFKQLRAAEARADVLEGREDIERPAREAHVLRLQRRIVALEAEIAALRASTSWRVTAPLRALGRLTRKGAA